MTCLHTPEYLTEAVSVTEEVGPGLVRAVRVGHVGRLVQRPHIAVQVGHRDHKQGTWGRQEE